VDGQLGEAGQRRGALGAGGEHQGDRFGHQPAGDESERLHRDLVEPLGVVDDTQQWLLVSGSRQQVQHGQADEEPFGGGPHALSERDVEGVALGLGQLVQVHQQRSTQLVQAGVGQFHIRFHAGHVQTAQAVGPVEEVLEQSGLPGAGLTAQHQHVRPPRAHRGGHLIQGCGFSRAAVQRSSPTPARHIASR
jgi:hypothetical protein